MAYPKPNSVKEGLEWYWLTTEKDGKVGTTDYDYITDIVVKAACNNGISWSEALCVMKILDKDAYDYMKDIDTWVVGQPELDDLHRQPYKTGPITR